MPQSVLFLDSSQGSASSHCFFSIRDVASAAVLAGDMQAMTDVSEMAQNLISVCEEAMTTINCANTEGDACTCRGDRRVRRSCFQSGRIRLGRPPGKDRWNGSAALREWLGRPQGMARPPSGNGSAALREWLGRPQGMARHLSRLTRHLSRLSRHLSRLTRHLSRLSRHLSRLSPFDSSGCPQEEVPRAGAPAPARGGALDTKGAMTGLLRPSA
jgi:hypothetical protein